VCQRSRTLSHPILRSLRVQLVANSSWRAPARRAVSHSKPSTDQHIPPLQWLQLMEHRPGKLPAVHHQALRCSATTRRWYHNFRKYNACLSKLARPITRLALLTYSHQPLSTRHPRLLSVSFSHSNLAVRIQRAGRGPKDCGLWLINFSTRDPCVCLDVTQTLWMLHNENIMNGADVAGSGYVLYQSQGRPSSVGAYFKFIIQNQPPTARYWTRNTFS
jgi:hypothetical protein